MNKTINTSLTTLCLLSMSFGTLAAEKRNVYSVEVAAENDDNVTRTIEKRDDTAFSIAPSVEIYAGKGTNQFSFVYDGYLKRYDELDSFDYDEHKATLSYAFDPTARFNGGIQLTYDQRQELPGETNAPVIPTLTEFNQEKRKTAQFNVAYGTNRSIGQLVLEGRLQDSEFDNNEQSFRDNDSKRLAVRYFYRFAPKTRGFIETSYEDVNYDGEFDQSSNLLQVRGGVEWEITGKTSGFVKIGHQRRDYDNDTLLDLSGLSYSVDLIWRPNSFTMVRLVNSRDISDSAVEELNGYIVDRHAVSVSHELTPRLLVKANAGIGFYDIDTPEHDDTRVDLGLSFEYELTSRIDITLGVKHASRDSDLIDFEFDATQAQLGIRMKVD